MSDIRKDFEVWAVKPVPVTGQLYSESYPTYMANNGRYSHPFTECAYEGYKAGRTHDIEGLIAEVEDKICGKNPKEDAYGKSLDRAFTVAASIIRKHFGKE